MNLIKAEEVLEINNKLSGNDENKAKMMYYGGSRQCSTKENNHNIIGIILFICLISYIIYRLLNNKNKFNFKFLSFTKNHDIIKLLIGLLLLNHVRLLSSSLINNLVLPLIEPIIPFLECNFTIKYYNTYLEIGKFMTDILVFLLNIFILYVIYIILHTAK